MQKVLFLKPQFKERLWGGTQLKDQFNYQIPSPHTGECWAISAHENGDCTILNGELKGLTLSQVYQQHKELFSPCENEAFPLLTKILDANEDLSVQVHPDNAFAVENLQDPGKTECWYIIDCSEDAELILGHRATTDHEFHTLVENNEWEKLLIRIKIHPGDFFYVPSGTIHALCKGTLVLETQQSSDTTFRLYDYDRKDSWGQKRELHLENAIKVTQIPHEKWLFHPIVMQNEGVTITQFVESAYFTVEKWTIKSDYRREGAHHFYLMSVLNGEGVVLNEPIHKGDHLILTSINEWIDCSGDFEAIVSYL